jgi:hypothetical protein
MADIRETRTSLSIGGPRRTSPCSIDDELSSPALVGEGGSVRVIPAREHWLAQDVRSILKDG